MDGRTKRGLLLVIVGVSLFAALMNLSAVLNLANKIIGLVLPVIVGGILALFIHVPMNGIKKCLLRAFSKGKERPSDKAIHISSFVLTLVCVFLILALVLALLVPEIVRSVQSLYAQIEERLAYISSQDFDVQWLEQLISEINLDDLTQKLSAGIDAILTNVVGALSSAVNIAVTAVFAVIISIYISLEKERLCRNARTLVCAYLKPAWAERVLYICRLLLYICPLIYGSQP